MSALLRLDEVSAGYGAVQVLRGVTLDVQPGQIHCLVGRNGAGKTTTLKAIMRLVDLNAGRMLAGEADVSDIPAHQVPQHGIAYVPQGRRLFADLSVDKNLAIGLGARRSPASVRDRMLALFPVLRARLKQRAGTLSGGEQQMLAMARALCIEPKVLLLDEPTEGLQPSIIQTIRDVVLQLRADGVGILLVEQRIDAIRALADHVTILETGVTRESLSAGELAATPDILARYLGV